MIAGLPADAVKAFLGEVRDTQDPRTGRRETKFEGMVQDWDHLGMTPGDRVLLVLPNSTQLLEQVFAAWQAGLVPALLSPASPTQRVLDLVRKLGARAVVSRRNLHLPAWDEGGGVVGGLPVTLFPCPPPAPSRPGEAILLTSGTSGIASACLFDLSALLLNAERHAEAIGQKPGDTVLVSLPFYFSFALVAQALATFSRGGRLWIASQPFHPTTYKRELADHQVTLSSLTPVQVHRLPPGDWPATLRALTVGGDVLDPGRVEALLAQRPGKELYLTYGTTPAGPRISTLAAHQEPSYRFASVGLPLAGTHVQLRPRPDLDQGGELLVASATVMKRRLGLLEAPAPDWAAPGLLASGDVFRRDADGYLYFLNRLSDFIVAGGQKICLASVRRLASNCPGVISARTHPRKEGYDLLLISNAQIPESELTARLMKSLRPAERPRRLSILSEAEAGNDPFK
jgi:acyl-CoA synthetase (AMP-forming)/AMP-acid ligase II